MDDLKKTLATVAASLQVLGANTTFNTQALDVVSRELSLMAVRNRESEQAVRSLQGTFAGIEVQMVRQFELAHTQGNDIADLRRRVEALERGRPPAA